MKDGGTEQFLRRWGCEFAYEPAWPLDRIDFDEAERSNMARLGKRYDEKRALDYAQLWEDGIDFPAIIIFRPVAGDRAALCDGLHRGRGASVARIGGTPKETIDVYVIENELDEFRREVVVRSSNSWHGVGSTREQNLAHIGEVVSKWPDATIAELSKGFGVGVSTIKNHLKALEATERGRRLGLDDIMSAPVFTQSLKIELQKIHSDAVFTRAAQTIWEAKLRGGPAEVLAIQCRKARTETAAAAICEQKMGEIIADARRNKAVIGRSPSAIPQTFIGKARGLVNFPRDGMIKNLHLDGLPPSSWPGHVMLMEELIKVASAARDELMRLTNLKDRMPRPPDAPESRPLH
jgi:hypothetical protein